MEEKAAESAGELAALEGLVADLGPLAGLLPERAAPEQDFNLFELLNQWWQEDVHSRCLTWLLDPQGSHGAPTLRLRQPVFSQRPGAGVGHPQPVRGYSAAREDRRCRSAEDAGECSVYRSSASASATVTSRQVV